MKKDKIISIRINSKKFEALINYLNSPYSTRLNFINQDPKNISELIQNYIDKFLQSRNIKF